MLLKCQLDDFSRQIVEIPKMQPSERGQRGPPLPDLMPTETCFTEFNRPLP